MKMLQLLSLSFVTVMALTFVVVAEDSVEKPAETKTLKTQTHCPVMGGKIDSTAYTDIQGQRVYHCCPSCTKALKDDPDKYFKQAAADGVLFENIQTFCPVSGEQLTEKTSLIDYEGRRVYFCCDKCKEPFSKDPAKYLSILDKREVPATSTDPSTEAMEHMDHHNH